ncbi:MAG: aminotransferase class I/II-fold pyridoxal phosphate-dependent enzyme [Haloarculaceae archaeon]
MDIAPFELERWLAEHEHDAAVNLGDSGVRPLDAARFDTDPGELGYVIPTQGDPALRETVSERYGRGAAEVAFTCGTQEANFLVFASLLDEDGHAVTVTPTYQSLHAVPEAVGEVTRVPLSPPDWELDPAAVAEAVRPETDLIVLNNPNNPTGRNHDAETVRALYELAEDYDAFLLGDEVYRGFADDPVDPVASMGPRGISTAGLSKTWGLPGLRFGWVAGPEDVVTAACEWKDYTTISPSAFGQHVARQALDREAELVGENREHARHNRGLVADSLEEWGLSWHEPVGVTGFATVPERFESGEAFCRRLVAETGVLLVPGDSFGHPGYVRIGFGVETAELREGLDRIGSFLQG